MKDYHIVPEGDLIEHDLDGDACVCGPKVEIETDGNDGDDHVYTHASLDGRELEERRTGKTTEKSWGVYHD